jgi:hypothetical protein
MEEQTGNVQNSAPSESHTAESSGDFFSALDQSVNSGIIESQDELSEPTSYQSADPLQSQPEVQQNGSTNWEKRYQDSSREGKRLNKQLQDIEPYMPILSAMKDDPELITHVRNYFEGGGQAPTSMKERLELEEDFVFDQDEAYSNPESDSAKLMGATIDGVVKKRLKEALSFQKNEQVKASREGNFRQKHNMNDDEWGSFVDYAKNHTLQLDDIYYLKNRENRENNIEMEANKRVSSQMQKTQSQPTTLAASGSTPVSSSTEDTLFDAILGIDKKLESAFG